MKKEFDPYTPYERACIESDKAGAESSNTNYSCGRCGATFYRDSSMSLAKCPCCKKGRVMSDKDRHESAPKPWW